MRTSAIPIDTARALYDTLGTWEKVAGALYEQTGRHWSPSTIQKIVRSRDKGRPPPFGTPWTDHRVELLKKLQAENLSSGDIAAELYRQTGHDFSRNAVISKLAQQGLSPQGQKRSPLPRTKPARRPDRLFGQPNTIKAWKPPPLTEDQKEYICGIPLEKLTDHRCGCALCMSLGPRAELNRCKWPINDPPRGGEYLFCGAKPIEGLSYCEYHSARAYQPAADRRRERRAG